MQTTLPLVLVLVVVIIILSGMSKPTRYTNVKIGNTTVKVEIADTVIKQSKGLMFRKSLGKNEGMLFIFSNEGYHTFWMVNMSFPIDIIWISANRTIVDITKNAEPCFIPCKFYSPKEKAQYVLEVNSGFADKHKIKIGQKAKFNLQV